MRSNQSRRRNFPLNSLKCNQLFYFWLNGCWLCLIHAQGRLYPFGHHTCTHARTNIKMRKKNFLSLARIPNHVHEHRSQGIIDLKTAMCAVCTHEVRTQIRELDYFIIKRLQRRRRNRKKYYLLEKFSSFTFTIIDHRHYWVCASTWIDWMMIGSETKVNTKEKKKLCRICLCDWLID